MIRQNQRRERKKVEMKKAVVVYYSWSNGNTKRITELLAEGIGADIVRIDTAEHYKGSYNEVVSQGQREVNKGYKPPIKSIDADLSKYGVIAIGTPTWWYTMAPRRPSPVPKSRPGSET